MNEYSYAPTPVRETKQEVDLPSSRVTSFLGTKLTQTEYEHDLTMEESQNDQSIICK